MFHSRVGSCAGWLALALLVGGAACSKEKLNEMVEKSKEQINKGVEQAQQQADQVKQKISEGASKASDTAQQQLQLAGDMQLTLDEPLKASACYVIFIPANAGRPSVLKVKSYRDAKTETFPSVLIQATVEAASLTELRGQTVAAQMYVQTEANGPIWFADGGRPVQLKIATVEDKVVSAQIAGGTLVNATDGKQLPAAAQLNGVID